MSEKIEKLWNEYFKKKLLEHENIHPTINSSFELAVIPPPITQHEMLVDKWSNDNNLLLGSLLQPSQSKNSIECDCGSRYTRENKQHHIKTKTHLKFIEKQNNNKMERSAYDKNRNVHINGFTYDNKEIISKGHKCVYETCVCCGIEYPLTPSFFHTQYSEHKTLNIERKSGEELVNNSFFYGCIICSKKVSKDRRSEEKEIKRQMIKQYNGDLTIEWLEKQLEKQNNRCHITNLPVTLERGFYYSASVQNNGKGRLHYKANCVVIMQCLQVQEHSIENLKDAWKQILISMKKEKEFPSDTTKFLQELDVKFSNNPKENGVTSTVQVQIDGIKKMNPEYSSQCANLHLPRILRDQVERYFAIDHRSKQRKDKSSIEKLNPDDIIQKLHNQKGRCYISNVPFSFNRFDPNYWSLERIDNLQHHTIENTVLICRIMNGRTQLSKEIIQLIYDEYYKREEQTNEEILFSL